LLITIDRFFARWRLAIVTVVLLVTMSASAWAENVTLNLKDADIRALINTVSEVTGKNFIVDPRVKGKVNVVSSRPLDEEGVYQVFLSILEVHGYAAVPSGQVIKILPAADAKSSGGVPVEEQDFGDEVVTRVFTVKHIDANSLVPILRPLVAQQGHIVGYPSSNSLIISDTARNINRIRHIVARIDVPSADEIEVIPLRHSSATDVVRVLSALTKADKGKGGVAPTLVADERTNSVLLGGGQAERLRLRAIIAHLDTPTEDSGNTQVVYLNFANAADLAPILTSVSTGIAPEAKGKAAGARNGELINIQADEATNALVITAPADVMRTLRSVIGQLDVRRAQVAIEAVIAEVSNTKVKELGIQFKSANSGITNGSSGTLAGSNLPGTGQGINELGQSPLDLGLGLTLGYFSGTSSVFGTDVLDFTALIRALSTDDNTNVLSTPSLVTLDNEEAEIIVGQNVPFLTGTTQTTGGLANPFQTIEREDVGLKLKIKPQINEGSAIRMDIEQEISSLTTSSSTVDVVTSKRAIKTSVVVDDGSMVVLGGLIEDNLVEGIQKVPGLGDIPVLGHLFQSKNVTKTKTNLLIFLRPQIMRSSQKMLNLVNQKYNHIRTRQQALRKKGIALLPDEESPLLPEFNDYLALPPPFEKTPLAGANPLEESGESAQ
jgi:general secretion pathway protein D